ncbi:glutamate receptor ionotropic, kainate 2-like isoform X2 [Plodia interpunctella]|uniref:glutamate receptor ionotropic, kainate 2-like isoform X2 n=1 Tax=Plodia interpunctella TaxID=58824 RepID=UPI0023687D49|nr:glutamate receptor ionotropic, kainate 2-like isoform X2 [Plodia interpunctella]
MTTMKPLKILISLLLYQILGIDAMTTNSFPIGGLFTSESNEISKKAFEIISQTSGTKAIYGRTMTSVAEDSYSIALNMCPLTSGNKGIVALIDSRPSNGICDTTCLLCNRLNITHLALGWQPIEKIEQNLFTFSYHPPPGVISKAFARLIKDLQWDKFTILYEDDSSFIRLQEIINTWPQDRPPIIFRKLDPIEDNKEILKHVIKVLHMSYYVLDCKIEHVNKYMDQIIEVENSTEYLSFILTNLDSYKIDLSEVPELRANVSTLYLTTASEDRWKEIKINPEKDPTTLETALLVDALRHVETAIRSMQQESEGGTRYYSAVSLEEPPALCFKDNRADYVPWSLGDNLRQALRNTILREGFTGDIEFDDEGKRTNFVLQYSKLNQDMNFINVGFWDSKTDLITKINENVSDRSSALKSNVIKIVTRLGKPYYFENPNGTEGYRGYAIDLVDAIFKEINRKKGIKLEYEFYRAPHDAYGKQIEGTSKWNGILGELIEHRAQLGICDLTVTSERNAVVDFSIPFMTLGISMLFREPPPEDPNKFSFIKPLAFDVWLYLATTYIIVSFVLLLCARMSQDDWVNPHPCNRNPKKLQNIWSLYNCMWLTMGSIMTQGCDILPRGVGSRWMAGVWWFFAMIITASYTANMSTFISNDRRSNDISNVKTLSEQNRVSYGAVYNSSTYYFFKNSNDSVYQKIWSVMNSAKPSVFMNSNDEGKERVFRSESCNYAFFMESTAIEYYIQRNCALKMVGSKLDSKEYAIAMPKNYPRKEWIDNAILSLQELGELTALEKKWWEDEDNEQHCKDRPKSDDDGGSLQMKSTSGIFMVLGLGGILGLFVAIIDFLMHARQIAVKENVTFKEALKSEWNASCDPRVLHKPAAPPRSGPPSSESGTPSPLRQRSQSRAVGN